MSAQDVSAGFFSPCKAGRGQVRGILLKNYYMCSMLPFPPDALQT